MRKHQAIIVSITLFALIAILQIQFSKNSSTILPSDPTITLNSYSDSSVIEDNRGNSTVAIDSVNEKGLFFHYSLTKQFAYYYAGVQLHLSQKINMSQYSHVSVEVQQEGCKTFRFFVLTNDTKVTDPDYTSSMRHMKHVINASDLHRTYTLELANFSTPQWWFETNNLDETEVDPNPFAQVLGFKFESGEGEPVNIRKDILLQKITFYTPIPLAIQLLQTVCLLTIIILLAFRFGLIGRVQLGKYTPIALGNVFDEDLEKITNFIGSNYQRPDLNIHHVEHECIMQADKVAALIKQGYGQTFKQYLNRLRLTEAQRLLRSTDRQISEIARAVGYTNPTHFNRVFKQVFSCTPREFRS